MSALHMLKEKLLFLLMVTQSLPNLSIFLKKLFYGQATKHF